jgi:hypothetical protein
MIHELKTWPEYYEKIVTGEKTFEVRKLDRFFNVGDTLVLKEWSPVRWQEAGGYSGREAERKVTYVMNGGKWDIPEGICIMGLSAASSPIECYPRWVTCTETNIPSNSETIIRNKRTKRVVQHYWVLSCRSSGTWKEGKYSPSEYEWLDESAAALPLPVESPIECYPPARQPLLDLINTVLENTDRKTPDVIVDAIINNWSGLLALPLPVRSKWSDNDMKNCFQQGRKYQMGEHNEYYGGSANKTLDFPEYLQSIKNHRTT